MQSAAIRYVNLKQDEDDEERYAAFTTRRKCGILGTGVLQSVLLLSGWLAFLIMALLWVNPHTSENREITGSEHLPRRDVKFTGSFRSESPYRGPPGPEIDAAWERFTASTWADGTAVVMSVDHDEVSRARKNTNEDWYNSTVELGEENGGGVMATLEMFHQLHCLDLIRRYTHFEHYKSKLTLIDTNPDLQRSHIDHCIEIVRQVIMCHGDAELITFHWVEGIPNPYPDYNVWHSCRDPEEVLALAKQREAPMKHRVRKVDGNVEMPSPP